MRLSKDIIEKIITSLHIHGHDVFLNDKRPYNLNIVAVRTDTPKVDEFRCQLYVFWKYDGDYYGEYFPITTLPGRYYLIDRLLNSKGCAILAPGQYIKSHRLGLHNGKYVALVQCRPVRVYRDGNKDTIYNYEPDTLDIGDFGINIHRANQEGKTPKVGKHSAGCLVFQNAQDFDKFIAICSQSREHFGNRFSLTLIEEGDIS